MSKSEKGYCFKCGAPDTAYVAGEQPICLPCKTPHPVKREHAKGLDDHLHKLNNPHNINFRLVRLERMFYERFLE